MSALKLHFFTFHDDKFINIRFNEKKEVIDNEGVVVNEILQAWKSVMTTIVEETVLQDVILNQPYTDANDDPQLIILLLKMETLASCEIYEAIAQSGLRRVSSNIKDASLEEVTYSPILTIGLEELTDLYIEKDRGRKNKNRKRFEDLKLDPRIHFWDSSIWHRYVPLYPSSEETFSNRFSEVVNDIYYYHNKYLYSTNAARATLEFQLRILRNSYISKFGESGHFEVVTPFKFHSETQMKREVEKIFPPDIDVSYLKWNALLVDDYSQSSISSLQGECKITKKELIENILKEHIEIEIKVPIEDRTKDRIAVIDHSIRRLSDSVYDLVLLDYLLGDRSKDDLQREYGHEFLQRLRWQKENNDLPVKRGPLGRHWVVPISSFPFAFIDKLQQLGISYSDDEFRISIGGDPICTPHFFCYNLLSLCKEQIDECVLYPSRLEKLIEHLNQITPKEKDLLPWARAFLGIVEYVDTKRNLLLKIDAEEKSLFAKSMNQFNKVIDYDGYKFTFRKMKKVLEQIIKLNYEGNYETESKNNWESLLKDNESPFFAILNNLKKQLLIVADKNYKEAAVKIEEAKKDKYTDLDLSMKQIFRIPTNITFLKNELQELDLSNNQLNYIPNELGLASFHKLKCLYLQNNQFETIPEAIFKLKNQLEELDFSNNKGKYSGKNLRFTGTQISFFLEQELADFDKISSESGKKIKSEEVKVFISHARKDKQEKYKDEHMSLLERINKRKAYELIVWQDGEIVAGEKWDEKIKAKLSEADIVLLLITNAFLNSNYIDQVELKIALENQKAKRTRVIAIICGHCVFRGRGFEQLQVIYPKDDRRSIAEFEDREEAYKLIEAKIEKSIENWIQ